MVQGLTFFSAILLVLGMTFSGAHGAPGFDDQEIRIGTWGPQTGVAAVFGQVARGAGVLFDLVNEEGGVHGRKIKYFIRDDQYNPAQTVAVVKELVEKQYVFAVTGGVGAPAGMAVKDYLQQHKIIWVGPATSIRELIEPVHPYVFAVYPLFEDEASVLTKYIVEKLQIKKIGVLYQNDPFGKNGLAGCRQRMGHYGMKVVAEIPVEPKENDLTSQIMKFKESGAQSVVLWVNPSTAVIALKTAANIGYKPQWVTPISDYPLMYKISGGLWEGVIMGVYAEPLESNHPLIVKYRGAAKRLAPEEKWGVYHLSGILFAEPLVDALKRAGKNLSTEAVLKALNSTKDFKGIGPRITWTPAQHQGSDAVRIEKCGPGGTAIPLQDWTSNDLATWRKRK